MTDAQIESLAGSLMAWRQIQPTGMWLLDQDAVAQTVPDLSGNGANQTARNGSTVGTVSCPLGYGMDLASG